MDELQRRKKVRRNMDWVSIGGNVIGAVLTNIYLVLNSNVDLGSGRMGEASLSAVGAIAVLIALGAIIGSRYEAPLSKWYLGTAMEENPAPAPMSLRRRALNVPMRAAILTLTIWTLAGLVSGLGMSISLNEPNPWAAAARVFVGVSVISGSISAALTYFAHERIWQPELAIFFPEGELSSTDAFRMDLRRRLLVLFFISNMPLVLLAMTSYSQAVNAAQRPIPNLLRIEWLVVGIGMLSAVGLALTLGATLVNAVETLRRQMTAVRQGDLEGHIPVTSNDELGDLATGFNMMVGGLRQEEVIRRLFGRYVSPEVAEHAIEHGSELGGQLVECTVLFSDIRGFTSLTEQMEPEGLIALLNRYFQAMSDAVVIEDGMVNKFGGDSLLAVFGTPLNPAEDHPQRALRAAQGMLAALEGFNREQAGRGEPILRIGIGIATGAVLAGNVGSAERLEYTVIGDAVNLASRLEGMTKELKVPVLLSETTALAAQEGATLGALGEVEVRGKRRAVQVYGLS